MCHLSPTVHLAWAILACGLQTFLVLHLWRYDRFHCLAWSSGRQPGTFKRVMTYSYLASVPALVAYSVSMAILKYRNGYTFIPEHGIIPTPSQFWSDRDQAWLTPLYILFGVAWGLELVTHLEELTFWLFLLNQGPARRKWFSSIEFRTWAILSVMAMTGMPLTAIFTRSNPLTSEAYIFLVGGTASGSVTAVFFIVLAQFPDFLRRVKKEGAAGPVVLRLVKFHELNILRVIFRLFMTIPLIILGVDGVHGHHMINNSPLWTDLLAFFAAVGTVVSSTLTLLIFFPRSLAEDSNWRPHTIENLTHGSFGSRTVDDNSQGPTILYTKRRCSGDYDENMPSPFANPEDTLSPIPSAFMTSKSKPTYFSDRFSPTALTTTYYPPSLVADSRAHLNADAGVDRGFRGIEEGIVDEDNGNQWRMSDLRAEPDDMRDGDPGQIEKSEPLYAEDGNRRGATRASKDNSHLKVRMMELGKAVEAGLQKPARPPRLHPYITSFTSPIDLLQYDDGEVPRAI